MMRFCNVWKKGTNRRKGNPWLLAGANLTVPPGRRVALLSTQPEDNKMLLRMFSGLVQPDEGLIVRKGLFSLPVGENSFLDFRGTFRQNANFLGLMYGYDEKEIGEIALEISGVKVRDGKPLTALVSADRVRISLGFLLAIPFDWYFINENIPKVPADMVESIEHALADRISRGSVVWATTKPEFLEGYCNAGLVVDRGGVAFYDDIDEACAVYKSVLKSSPSKK